LAQDGDDVAEAVNDVPDLCGAHAGAARYRPKPMVGGDTLGVDLGGPTRDKRRVGAGFQRGAVSRQFLVTGGDDQADYGRVGVDGVGRLERWSFRAVMTAMTLVSVGGAGSYWTSARSAPRIEPSSPVWRVDRSSDGVRRLRGVSRQEIPVSGRASGFSNRQCPF
jgi:hypothetical protein